MKNKIVRSLLVMLMLTGLCIGADTIDAHAVSEKEAAKESTVTSGSRVNHYYYYSNGAIRSLNNRLNSTYRLTENEFTNTVGNLADTFLQGVNYDDTRKVWEKPSEDNLSSLRTILDSNSTQYRWKTNYTDKELQDKNLIPESVARMLNDSDEADSSNEGLTENQNLIDTGNVSTSELVKSASYLIEHDYYTIPKNISVTCSPGYSIKATTSDVKNKTEWYYAKHKQKKTISGKKTTEEVENPMLKSDIIMILSKIYHGVQNSSAVVLQSESERDGAVWTTADTKAAVSGGSGFSLRYPDMKSGAKYYGSTYNVYGGGYGNYTDGYGNSDPLNTPTYDGYNYYGVQFIGDFWVYYDPNVYELYLAEALQDGIIDLDDLSDLNGFAKDYSSMSAEQGNFAWSSGKYHTKGSDFLGYSKSVSLNSASLDIIQKMPDYFGKQEQMSMIEGLRLIEAYMRANDENMSETEEKIIRYKLGLNVLSSLSDEDCSTITYLIARGILDGNSMSLTGMISGDATVSRMLPLLYRVANKNARYDFCTIQLTDSETFWESEGFAADSFNILVPEKQGISGTEVFDIVHEVNKIEKIATRKKPKKKTTASVMPDSIQKSDTSNLADVIEKSVSPVTVHAAKKKTSSDSSKASTTSSNKNEYEVTMYFDKNVVYYIGSTTIGQLAKGSNNDSELTNNNIKSIEEKSITYNGGSSKKRDNKIDVYVVIFSVTAKSQEEAATLVQNKIRVSAELDQYQKAVTGVTQINANGTKTNLVSQSSLKSAFSNIVVLKDKILMNSLTGTLAYFSYDSKVTLVGSQVITSDYSCITKAGDEIYYDLNAILPLLSAAYVDTIGTQTNIVRIDIKNTKTVNVSTDFVDKSDYPIRAQYINVLVRALGSEEDADTRKGVGCLRTENAEKMIKKNNMGASVSDKYFLKLNTLSGVSSTLTKAFTIDYNGTPVSGTVVLDLQYLVPDPDNFQKWMNDYVDSKSTMTYNDASSILFVPPEDIKINGKKAKYSKDSPLSIWYHSNYGMSNALCNWMYGTQGHVYVPSGYMCPSVSLLIDAVGEENDSMSFTKWCKKNKGKRENASAVRDTVLTKIFSNFELGDDYKKYNGGTGKMFWKNFFQCDVEPSNLGDYDFKAVGFSGVSDTSVKLTIAEGRTFEIYEEASLKDSVAADKNSYKSKPCENLKTCAVKQHLKFYGTVFAVSGNGNIYRNLESFGKTNSGNDTGKSGTKFVYSINRNKHTISSLQLVSYKTAKVKIPAGSSVYVSNSDTGIGSSKSLIKVGDTARSTTWTVDSAFSNVNGQSVAKTGVFKITFAAQMETTSKGNNKLRYYMQYGSTSSSNPTAGITSVVDSIASQQRSASTTCKKAKNDLVIAYNSSYTKVVGNAVGAPDNNKSMDRLESKKDTIFVDPSQIQKSLKKLFKDMPGDKIYIYTDKASGTSDLYPYGTIYMWDGKKLKKVTNGFRELAQYGTTVYALGRYYVPKDQSFISSGSDGKICLTLGIANKALNYMQYDMASINNQLIEAYLVSQFGTVGVNTLPEGTELMIGSTAWVKQGEWWQSKPLKNIASVNDLVNTKSNSKQLTQLIGQKIFSGKYVTIQGKQYPLTGYVKSTAFGGQIGSEKQKKRGILYESGSSLVIDKQNGSGIIETKSAKKSASADYVSIKCKFDDHLLARPINARKTKYSYVGHSGVAMITSADYPFFDIDASWDANKLKMYNVGMSKFKPSPAFDLAKKNFMDEFRDALREDTWNFVWAAMILLASYLLIMSWLAFGIVTMGVGRTGFKLLEMRDASGNRRGVDILKFATFGIYSLDQDLTLIRVFLISLGCCCVMTIALSIIF